jgi:4-amino-4-deoxy-L-arabinose transferase-like glycosyltransferase
VWAGIVAALALLVRLPFMFDPKPVLQPDSYGYLSIADSLIGGHGFGSAADFRPPGYPLFLVMLRIIPGDTSSVIVVVQHLLGVALAVAILLVAWRFFGRLAAIVAGVLAAISPSLVAVEHEVLSDYLFLLVVFAGTASLAYFARSRSWRLLIIPGLLFGYATLTKPLGQSLVAVAPIALLVLLPRWKPALRSIAIVTLAMAITIVPWVVRNEAHSGHAVISRISDQVLFWRVFDGDRPLPFAGHDPLTNKVRAMYANYRAGRTKEPVTVWVVYAYLKRQGYSEWGAGAVERKIALRAIRAAPVAFAKDSINHLDTFARTPAPGTDRDALDQLTASYHRSVASAPGIVGGFEASAFAWPVLNVASYLVALWWLASVFGLAGLLLLRSRDEARRTAAVTYATVLGVMGLALALTGLPQLRYNAVALPLLWTLGSAGLVPLWTAVYRWGWQRAATPAAAAGGSHAS